MRGGPHDHPAKPPRRALVSDDLGNEPPRRRPLEVGPDHDGPGELVIAWLHGEITQTPGHCGPPCDETIPLTPALTIINRGGFVTDNSQLAESVDGYAWNTWVDGFATDETLALIRKAVIGTPLIVRACRGRIHEHVRIRVVFVPCPRTDVTASGRPPARLSRTLSGTRGG